MRRSSYADAASEAARHFVGTFDLGRFKVAQRPIKSARIELDDVSAAAQVDDALVDVDVLVMPTLPDAPVPLRAACFTQDAPAITRLVRPFNPSGHPAIASPVPANGSGPVSLFNSSAGAAAVPRSVQLVFYRASRSPKFSHSL